MDENNNLSESSESFKEKKVTGLEDVSVFDRVPTEIMWAVLKHMDLSTLKVSRLTCSAFRSLIDQYFVRARIILSNETYRYVQKSQLLTSTLIVKDFTSDCSNEPKTISRSKLAKNAKQVIITASTKDGRERGEENISMILLLNPKMESLVFEENSLRFIRALNIRGELFTHLTCLSVDFSYSTDRQVFQHFVKLRLPSLKSVQLSEYWSDYGPETGPCYLGMYQFLGNHKRTLKYVTLVHPMRNNDLRVTRDINLPSRYLQKLRKDLAEIQLDSLYLYLVSIEGVGNFTLGCHLLASQTRLAKLQVAIGGNYFYALPHIQAAIQANSDSLDYLSVISHEQWGVYVNLSNTLSPLPDCKRLESFEVDHFFMPSLPPLPPSLKILSINGYLLSDQVLPQIDESLINLEQVSYTDMSLYPYTTPDDKDHFKRLLKLPKLKRLRICKHHLGVEFRDFLCEQQGISWSEVSGEVTFRNNYLPFYEILVTASSSSNTN